jgi:hypothetical protein
MSVDRQSSGKQLDDIPLGELAAELLRSDQGRCFAAGFLLRKFAGSWKAAESSKHPNSFLRSK